MTNKKFSHFDDLGNPSMVDINQKKENKRLAIANGMVSMQPKTLDLILDQKIQKF